MIDPSSTTANRKKLVSILSSSLLQDLSTNIAIFVLEYFQLHGVDDDILRQKIILWMKLAPERKACSNFYNCYLTKQIRGSYIQYPVRLLQAIPSVNMLDL